MRKILGAVLALGFVFRVLFLGHRQLWTDELIQALVMRAGSLDELVRNLKGGVGFPAPLDYVVQMVRASAGSVPVVPAAARRHSGTVSIWLFYRISLMLFGARVALYSAALFAIYPLHQHYSQEGRPYALLVLLTLASYYFLIRSISRKTAARRPGPGLLSRAC